ncbi:hypothetical protein PoB_000092900 [Plakobranchus ocellatus]|uniref:Uncharacterized protein n=1 Tax=Plakobranchus ocellatus TaxID=259542 RepID=A0AAV3XXD7_9GAST|nr:hypothetical protein PoB_000092900 [Plakobranchus ocellatus]
MCLSDLPVNSGKVHGGLKAAWVLSNTDYQLSAPKIQLADLLLCHPAQFAMERAALGFLQSDSVAEQTDHRLPPPPVMGNNRVCVVAGQVVSLSPVLFLSSPLTLTILRQPPGQRQRHCPVTKARPLPTCVTPLLTFCAEPIKHNTWATTSLWSTKCTCKRWSSGTSPAVYSSACLHPRPLFLSRTLVKRNPTYTDLPTTPHLAGKSRFFASVPQSRMFS